MIVKREHKFTFIERKTFPDIEEKAQIFSSNICTKDSIYDHVWIAAAKFKMEELVKARSEDMKGRTSFSFNI